MCPDHPVHGVGVWFYSFLVRRPLSKRLTGWLSYTLSRSDPRGALPHLARAAKRRRRLRATVIGLTCSCYGVRPWPQVAVGEVRLLHGLALTRMMIRRARVLLSPLNDQRYPPFYRVDVRLEKRWTLGKERSIAMVAKVQNVTLSKEARAYNCSGNTDRLDQLDDVQCERSLVPSRSPASVEAFLSSARMKGSAFRREVRVRPRHDVAHASSCVFSGALAAFAASRASRTIPRCSPSRWRWTSVRARWPGLPERVREAFEARTTSMPARASSSRRTRARSPLPRPCTDGRSALRQVSRMEDVCPTLEALLLVPRPAAAELGLDGIGSVDPRARACGSHAGQRAYAGHPAHRRPGGPGSRGGWATRRNGDTTGIRFRRAACGLSCGPHRGAHRRWL